MKNKLLIDYISKGALDILVKYFLLCGTIIAIHISWDANWSIGWAILHGFFAWLYIFYAKGYWVMLSISIAALLYSLYKSIFAVSSLNKIVNSIEESLKK